MIRAVVYDLDDTMVNSYPLHVSADVELLKEYGHTFDEIPDDIKSGFVGMRVIDMMEVMAKHFKIDTKVEAMYRRRSEIFLQLVKEKLELLPGLAESLKRFKENGYKLAIASSGSQKYISLVLEKFNLRSFFNVIVTGDDVKVGKPNPETYLIAAEKLQLIPSDCLVLEDATKGVQAAKAAGCKCVAIVNPYIPAQDHSLADAVVNSFHDISLEKLHSL